MKIYFHYPDPSFRVREANRLKPFIAGLFKKEKVSWQTLHYIFCTDEDLLEINQKFLHHDTYTDIITFDLSENPREKNGEVYISRERVVENAKKFGVSFANELHRVIFHGALHLCGYKDKNKADQQEMRKREDHYLGKYFEKS